MPTISRAEMQAAIAAGGVVLHGDRFYSDPNDLPGEADLARGDPAREAAALEVLRSRRAALEAEIAALESHRPAPAPPSPVKPVPAPSPAPAPAVKPEPARPEPPKPGK